jgi:lipopolysaccharide export system ATP-binding protein
VSAPALRATGLRCRLGGQEVLRGVDLEATAGRVTGLVGPNGAGKSTAFGMLAGEIDGEGEVHLAGRDLRGLDLPARARLGLGYLPQGRVSLGGLRADEHLGLLAEVHGLRGAILRDRVAELLDALELSGRSNVRVGSLSGGERRRLEVAGVLLGGFPVMLLDEPFAGLEPRGVQAVSARIRVACVQGAAVLLSDHSPEALAMCDEAVLLVRGEVLLKGPASTLRLDAVVREVYLGVAALSDAKAKPTV